MDTATETEELCSRTLCVRHQKQKQITDINLRMSFAIPSGEDEPGYRVDYHGRILCGVIYVMQRVGTTNRIKMVSTGQ